MAVDVAGVGHASRSITACAGKSSTADTAELTVGEVGGQRQDLLQVHKSAPRVLVLEVLVLS